MRQFFVDPSAIGVDTITITGEDVRHIDRVLRMSIGDPIAISDTDQWEYQCEIIAMDRDCVQARILDKRRFAREPKLSITLYQGIPKGNKMETVIQKCTELGVRRIVPVFMDRTVVTDRGKYGRKITRYRSIAAEAAKQCRRGRIPEVGDAIATEELLGRLQTGDDQYDLVLMPYENEKGKTIRDVLQMAASGSGARPENLAVIIGPEGGFSQEEAEAIQKSGAATCALGQTILRTETAGMVAISCILYELEW